VPNINFLNFPSLVVDGFSEDNNDYHVHAHSELNHSGCPACHGMRVVGFGRNEQLVKDLPMHGKRVGIYFDTRRFRCNDCSRTFLEKHPDFHSERAMTARLAKWIGQQSIRRTFSSLAEETGVVEGTVRNIFRDHINELEKAVKFETPVWMGIDEIHIIKPRGVITNIQNDTVVEVLVNRNQDTIAKFLTNLKDKERVQYVAMDMWRPYKNAVNAVLPQATIVIDKFHVVKMANEALEKVRKTMRQELTLKQKRGLMHDRFVLLKREATLSDEERLKLDGWILNYPLLGEVYRLKETFYGVYESKTIPEARAAYELWQKSIPPELAVHFHDLTRAFQNWMPEILSYFKHPVTNAYTECLNSLIRVIDRLGRGYSFEALRAKILFTDGIHATKKNRPRFERRRDDEIRFSIADDDSGGREELFTMRRLMPTPAPATSRNQHEEPEETLNFGADISTLVRLIEEGQI
jgi:transposase